MVKLVFKSETAGAFEEKVIDFFSSNQNPTDKEVHEFASSLGLEPDELEQEIYKMLSTFLGGGDAHKKKLKRQDVDKKELRMGIKEEKEHFKESTYSKKFAERIALDHLSKTKNFYTKSKKLEGANK